MTTKEVANRLVELCREGKIMEAQQELYADDITSTEPEHAKGMINAHGKQAVAEKGMQFASMIEEHHGGTISEPLIAGNHFSLAWGMDVTMKGAGRTQMNEICVYEVKDGKVVSERFFY
jgi:ketosteroid isomerase-like protein